MEKKSFSIIFSRFFAGAGAGIVGAIVLGIVILLSWSIIGTAFETEVAEKNAFGIILETPKTHPLFLVFVILANFLATISASLIFVILLNLIEEKYRGRATALTQTFFANLIILFLVLPIYLIFSGIFGSNGVFFAGIFHIFLVAIFAFFALEISGQQKYFLVNLYGIIFGIILFLFFGGMLFAHNSTFFTFASFPLIFGFFGGGNGIAEIFYQSIYQNYGVDFLNSDTNYHDDYSQK